jgi:hypothetical protein
MAITRCNPSTEAEIEAHIEWRTHLIAASLNDLEAEAVADRLLAIVQALPETLPIDHLISARLTGIASALTTSKPAER